MTMVQIVGTRATDAISALIAGLECEFGRGAGRALADRFLRAEDTDFHWDCRCEERFLGAYFSLDEEDVELDRVAIIGRMAGQWFVSICLVDGEGHAHGMIGRRCFDTVTAARKAWRDAR